MPMALSYYSKQYLDLKFQDLNSKTGSVFERLWASFLGLWFPVSKMVAILLSLDGHVALPKVAHAKEPNI